jgi:hypothetical protein
VSVPFSVIFQIRLSALPLVMTSHRSSCSSSVMVPAESVRTPLSSSGGSLVAVPVSRLAVSTGTYTTRQAPASLDAETGLIVKTAGVASDTAVTLDGCQWFVPVLPEINAVDAVQSFRRRGPFHGIGGQGKAYVIGEPGDFLDTTLALMKPGRLALPGYFQPGILGRGQGELVHEHGREKLLDHAQPQALNGGKRRVAAFLVQVAYDRFEGVTVPRTAAAVVAVPRP